MNVVQMEHYRFIVQIIISNQFLMENIENYLSFPYKSLYIARATRYEMIRSYPDFRLSINIQKIHFFTEETLEMDYFFHINAS